MKPFVINDENKQNSYGFKVKTAGIDTAERFDSNPICLNNHQNNTKDVLGKWKDYRKDGALFLGLPDFDTEDPDGKEVVRKVQNGTIKAVSMGIFFNPKDMVLEDGELWLLKCVLYEVSIVAVPSNANAIMLYNIAGGKPYTETEIKQMCLALQNPENHKQKSDMKLVTAHLQLAENANETEILTAIKAVEARLAVETTAKKALQLKYDSLVAENEAKLKAEFDAELAQAVKDGRIDEAGKTPIQEMVLKSGYEQGMNLLKALPKREPIADKLKGKEASLAAFDKMSWSELDKGNHLATLKAESFEYFKERFKKQYGKEYQE